MPDLRRFFAEVPRVRFIGAVYRICLELHRNSVASMQGAFLHGGRYNIRRYFGCLYTALEIETARAEIRRYLTVPPDIGLVEAALDLRLSQVVDLTASSVRRRVGVRSADLTGTYAICQELGLRAWESGVEGLLVPSAAVRGAKNLAVLLDNQAPGWAITLSGATLASSAGLGAYRRKQEALPVPFSPEQRGSVRSHEAFGMWKDRADLGNVSDYVRRLRRGR